MVAYILTVILGSYQMDIPQINRTYFYESNSVCEMNKRKTISPSQQSKESVVINGKKYKLVIKEAYCTKVISIKKK